MPRSSLAFSLAIVLAFGACASPERLTTAHPDEPGDYEMIDLGTLGASEITYGFFDDEGRVVAYGEGPDHQVHVFRWTNGVTTDLGALPDHLGSIAFSPRGLVAGARRSHDAARGTFFLFRSGALQPREDRWLYTR